MSKSNRTTLIVTYLLSVLLLVLSFVAGHEIGMSTAAILLLVNSYAHIIIEELSNREQSANANLIEAAPDMYEALKAMHDHFKYLYGEDDPYVLDSAKALAKVDGKGE